MMNLGLFEFKFKKKRRERGLAGRALASRPTAEAGPACLHARRPLARTRAPTAPGHASRVAAMRRRDRRAAPPACPVPTGPAPPSRPLSEPRSAFPSLSSLLHRPDSSARARLHHRAPCLAGVSSPGHPSSPSTAPSRPELCLHLTHPLLASVHLGKPSPAVNRSPE